MYTSGVYDFIKSYNGEDGADGADGTDGADGQMLYATCGTAASTKAKVATLSSGSINLKSGVTVAVTFTYDNTAASPTLNVGGTGAKTIHVYGSVLSASSVYNWVAGSTIQFVYDGTYWVMTENSALYTVAQWCYSNDTTYIDGSTIAAGTIAANSLVAGSITSDYIDVADLFAQDITATGTITGLTIKGVYGEIGGFIIGESAIYSGTASMYDETEGVYVGTDGIRSCSSDKGYINIAGGMIWSAGGSQFYDTEGNCYYPYASMDSGTFCLYADGYDMITSPIGAIELDPSGISFYCAENTAWCAISNLDKEIAIGEYISLTYAGAITANTLTVSSLTTINGTLIGNSPIVANGMLVANSTLNVVGAATFSGKLSANGNLYQYGDTYIDDILAYHIIKVVTCTLTSTTAVADGSTWTATGTCTAPSTYTGTITIPRYGNYGYPCGAPSISVDDTTATVTCSYRNASGGSHTLSAQCVVIYYI